MKTTKRQAVACSRLSILLVFGLLLVVPVSAWGQSLQTNIQDEDEPAVIQKDGQFAVASTLASKSIPFIANRGQSHNDVAFYAQTFCGAVFVTKEAKIVYSLPNTEIESEVKGWALEEEFINGRSNEPSGECLSATRVSYFKGKNPSLWKSDIPSFSMVDLGEVYEGIEVKLKAYCNNMEKLFIVNPGVSPDRISVRMKGANCLTIHENGGLHAGTDLGDIVFTKPVAFQEKDGLRKDVEVAYSVRGTVYGFELGDYDRELPLIIDPLIASTYLGGTGEDEALKVITDEEGYVYVGGYTSSTDFPVTAGAYQETFSGGTTDAFLVKFNESLTTLIAATYLGGSVDEGSFYLGLVLDGNGCIYMTGNSQASDFPTTPGAYDETYNGTDNGPYGRGDVFVCRFDTDLTTLRASTLLGGSGHEYCRSIVLDQAGVVYLGGMTSSGDFPVTPGAYDETHQNTGTWKEDVFVAKLDSDLTTLHAATYVGGGKDECVEGLALGPNDDIYVGGWTSSNNYPTTPGAFSPTYNGHYYDAFVSKLSNDLTALSASTYFGGTSWEFGYYLMTDETGNVYMTGHTASLNLPVSPDAYDKDYNGTGGYNVGDDVFIVKFDGDLSSVLACTYLGGDKWENASTMNMDDTGHIYLAGSTCSPNFPASVGAYSENYSGGTKYAGDLFISRLDSDLTTLFASTYLGGTAEEGSYTVSTTLSDKGDIFITGFSTSGNYPTTPGAYSQVNQGGGGDVVVSRLDGLLTHASLISDADEIPATTGATVNFILDADSENAGDQYFLMCGIIGGSPGTTVPGGMNVPCNWDPIVMPLVRTLNNIAVFFDFIGTLDANGQAFPRFEWPGYPGSAGLTITFAACTIYPFDSVTNPIQIEVKE